MPLETGKKQIQIAKDTSSIPYVPAKSNFSIAFDAFKPTIDRLENEAAITAQANYFQKFQIETRDQLVKFEQEFKNDPNGMKGVVDVYAKNLIEKVPPAYKLAASSMINTATNNLVIASGNNRRKLDEAKFQFDNEEIYKLNNTNAEFAIKTASEIPDINIAKSTINDKTAESINILNTQKNLDYNMLVVEGSKETRSDKAHMLKITNGTKALHISNGFHMMKTIGNEVEAYEWLNLLSENKNPTPIINKEMENNPTFKIFNDQLKDDDTRIEIVNAIANRYKIFKNLKLKELAKHDKFSISEQTELGMPLHYSNFSNSQNSNSEKYIVENYSGVSAADSIAIQKHIKAIYVTQDNVVKLKNGEILTGLSPQETQDTFTQLLSEFGINEDPSKILDVNDPNFQIVKTIFEKNGSIPVKFKEYISQPTGDLNRPEVMKGFKKQLAFYNQISGEFGGFHTDLDTDSFMYYASTNNLLELSDGEIAEAALKFNRKDNKEISESVNTQINNDVTAFEESINNALDNKTGMFSTWNPFRESVSRDLSLTTIFGDGNKFSKVLYPDSWTLWADGPWDLMSDGVKADFKVAVSNELKFMASGASVNISDPKTIRLATYSALNKMLKQNYTPSKFTKDNGYNLTKHGIENEFGLNDAGIVYSVLPTMDAWYATLSESEKNAGAFGVDEAGKKVSFEDVQAFMKDGDDRFKPVFEPTGIMRNGKMTYNVSIKNSNGRLTRITQPGENFQPGDWENINKEKSPSNKDEVLTVLADENYSFMEKLLGDFNTTEPTTKLLMRKFAHAGEKGLINLANWSWMVDVPMVDDVPSEIKPFKMLFNLLGKDVPDLDEKLSEIAIHNKQQAELRTYAEEINNSKVLDNKAKHLESLYPPHKQVHGSYRAGMSFQHYATTNYNNPTLALTHRTNNYMGIEKSKNDNSLDLKAENNIAVFAHPKDSIKASIIKMVNMSTIVKGDNKTFGDTPSIEELLTKFNPADKNLYLSALKQSNLYAEDMVNFQDKNQLASIIKFMITAKMGNTTQPGKENTFNTYYPKNNLMIDIYINEGVTEAFNTYAGIIYR